MTKLAILTNKLKLTIKKSEELIKKFTNNEIKKNNFCNISKSKKVKTQV